MDNFILVTEYYCVEEKFLLCSSLFTRYVMKRKPQLLLSFMPDANAQSVMLV